MVAPPRRRSGSPVRPAGTEDATAWSLARLNTAFFHHYDRREYDELLALFSPDAHYEVHGRKLRGHAVIRELLDARPGPVSSARKMYHQQTKNVLVSYSPKKLGFF
ncbi:nuclear transport factor 2 family protein [Streptomyces sp. NPDC057474]|uniref:nuclear transport factor 2 family protein n=1 Tax=Streptomyces sp. NPDC057474 TaxID=3346144 RepID=UPI0036A2E8B2